MSRALAVLAIAAAVFVPGATATGQEAGTPVASAFDFVKFPTPACAGVGLRQSPYFTRNDCGFAEVRLAGAQATDEVTAVLSSGGTELATVPATADGDLWQFDVAPEADWPAGPVTVTMRVGDEIAEGEGTFFLNQLGAELATTGAHAPGEPLACAARSSSCTPSRPTRSAPEWPPSSACAWSTRTASRPRRPSARSPPPRTARSTRPCPPRPRPRWSRAAPRTGARPCGSSCSAPASRTTARSAAASGPPRTASPPAPPRSPPSPTSPCSRTPSCPPRAGSSPARPTPSPSASATTRTRRSRTSPSPSACRTGRRCSARPPSPSTFPPAAWQHASSRPGPTRSQQDPQIVWKDLSSTATLGDVTATSHGPKVIPPSGGYETARYGDRPFPVVPVDFSDRAHGAGSSAGRLATKINDPETPGSTFNLYQEMSYGQLFPHGTVPSDGVATAGWDYEPGFGFTQNSLEPDTCRGVTNAMLPTPSADPARADPRRLVPAPGLDRLLRRRRQGLGADRRAGRRRRAAGHRLRLRADRQGRLRRRPDRRPGDRLQRLRHRQGRRRRLLHDGLPGRRRERRVAALRLRQHLAALLRPPGRLCRRERREGLRLRRPAHRHRGPAAVLDRRGPLEEDHAGHRHPGPRAGRAVQRQPRVGDREGQRDQPRVRPLARPARLLLDRLARDLRLLDADGLRPLAEHRHRRQEGARLGRPARARARSDPRCGRLAGHQARHQPDRLEAAGRHAVHAHGRRRPQRRGVRRAAARPPDHRPVARPLRRPRLVVALGQRLRLPAVRRPQPRHRAAGAARRSRGNARDAHLQVALGRRVGLRLRLRARDHRQRAQLQVVRVRERLHHAGLAEPERQRLPEPVRQRHHRLERLVRGGHADRRSCDRHVRRRARSSTTATT